MRFFKWATILCVLLVPALNAAADNQDVARILADKTAPSGIVFEIVEGREDALKSVLPMVKSYVDQLRSKFPNIEIAIVSHGLEEMGLTKAAAKDLPNVHSLVQQLADKDNVQLHVCELAAAYNDVSKEDFPDYVDVTAYGPAQLQDYEALGYVSIRVDSND